MGRRAPEVSLEACGRSLVRRLDVFRANRKNRPIIFIGHSLGGLVIEYGLLWAESDPEFRYLVHHTVGCIFLGCPFMGSKMQILARTAALILSPFGSHIGIIEKISYENDDLFHKLTEFCKLTRRSFLPVSCFYETYNTDYGGRIKIPLILSGRVVNKFSASIQTGKIFPLDTNHLQMNKYSGPNDRSFVDVSAEITEMYRNMGTLLKQLRAYSSLDTCQRVALEGLGGVGKTQIAIEAVYRLHHQDPSCSIFWVPATTPDAFRKAHLEIGEKLGISVRTVHSVALLSIKTALENIDIGRWLLVVDSADDEETLFGEDGLAAYLPFNRTGSILFTTRHHHAAVGLQASFVQVETMDESEATRLLQSGGLKLSLTEGGNLAGTRKLLDLMTMLPPAVQQASDYLNKIQISSTEYVRIYESSHDEKIYLLRQMFKAHGRYEGADNAIITTYFPSFDQIQTADSLAAELLRAIAFLSNHEIHREMLPLDGGLRRTNEAVGKLAAFAFIRRRDIEGFVYYDFHQLVQTSARFWMKNHGLEDQQRRERDTEEALERLIKMFPLADHAKEHAWTSYLAHAKSVLDYQEESNLVRASVFLQQVEDYCSDFLASR